MKKVRFITVLLLLFNLKSFSQVSSTDIVIGFGYPEIVHLGAKVHILKRNQIGIYYGNGILLSSEDYYHSFTFDHQYHFGKMSKFENRNVYYTRQSISYINYEDRYSKTSDIVCGITAGREFNITEKIGLSADLGIKVFLYQNREIKDESQEPMVDFSSADTRILPQFRVQLFYSF